MGSPRSIEDKKYDRNAFIFNFVFVFAADTDTSPHEAVILKLGDAFKSFEVSVSGAVTRYYKKGGGVY